MNEDMHTEFKREYIEDFKNTAVAFANTDGGELFFGIQNDGSVCGVQNPDDVMTRIMNALRDSVHPDITILTKSELLSIENKSDVRLTVQKGSARPYYLASKGIKPSGVFVRQGASSVPASENAIFQMIQESAKDTYESGISPEQNLTFVQCASHFASREVEFGDAQKKSLGLKMADGAFSNLALLLSDQCPHIIKVAVFQGSSKTVFKDRKEYSGSVLKQLEEAFAFLDMYNHTHAEVHGLERIDTPDYPGDAIRESLLNLLVHRDYAMLSPALISIFDDRIEFVSVGGLVPGISYDDIMLGISVTRNPKLANVFYRLRLIEAYGTGILKMNEGYAEYPVKPKIEVSSHAFKVTLPNVNFEERPLAVYDRLPRYRASYSIHEPQPRYGTARREVSYGHANPAEGAVYGFASPGEYRAQLLKELFSSQRSVSRRDVELLLKTSQANAVLILRRLLEEGKIAKVGNGKNVRYVLVE